MKITTTTAAATAAISVKRQRCYYCMTHVDGFESSCEENLLFKL